jgi:hypothetical protein
VQTLRSGKIGDEFPNIIESHKIVQQKILLSELPDYNNKVVISGFTEIHNVPPLINQFMCNYYTGVCFFNVANEGEVINVNLFGRGISSTPASRVWTTLDSNGDVLTTLEDIITAGQSAIDAAFLLEEFKIIEVYNNSKIYKVLNKVTYQGSTYQCILQSIGNLPTNTIYWILIAQKGDTGVQGIQGINGLDGASASDLIAHEEDNVIQLATKLDKTGDTATGILTAQANISYTVAQIHNVILSTDDAIIGSMGNGDLWIKYV